MEGGPIPKHTKFAWEVPMKRLYLLVAVAASLAAIAISQRQEGEEQKARADKADVEEVDSEMEAWFI